MKKITAFLITILLGILQAPFVIGGEIITGKACYRFSDHESIAAARDIALSMAKREALEGYAVFVNATATVNNYVLKNSIITSVSASVLNNMKITSKKENLEKREVCRTISAVVEEIEVKKEITSRIRLSQKKKNLNFDTGLHEDKNIKILKIKREKNKNGDFITMRGICKQRRSTYPSFSIMYYDEDGIPLVQKNIHFKCIRKNHIARASFYLPGYNYQYIKEAVDYTFEWIKE